MFTRGVVQSWRFPRNQSHRTKQFVDRCVCYGSDAGGLQAHSLHGTSPGEVEVKDMQPK